MKKRERKKREKRVEIRISGDILITPLNNKFHHFNKAKISKIPKSSV